MDIEYDAAALSEARQYYAKAQAHEADGYLADIDLAIEYIEKALRLLPKASHKWLVICKYYTWLLALRYKKSTDMEDLTASLYWINIWLDLATQTDEYRAHMLLEAADRYQQMFAHSKQKADLDQALSYAGQALQYQFETGRRKFFCMRDIAQMKSSMHDTFPNTFSYDEMIHAQKNVLKLTENMTNVVPRLESLQNLACAQFKHFETTKSATIAYEILPYAREWAKLSPDMTITPNACLPRLIIAQCLSFLVDNRLEEVDVLSEALTALEEALAMDIPLEERLQIIVEIQNLGWTRFSHQGNDVDYPEKAVQLCRMALSIIPDSHSFKPIAQRNLAIALERQFNYSGNRSSFDEAIDLTRTASANRGLSSVDRAIIYDSLSVSLLERFKLIRLSHDLTEAIALSREAVKLTPDSGQPRFEYLNTLQISLSTYANNANSLTELDEAINIVQNLLQEDKSAEGARMHYLNLGALYYDRYKLRREENDRMKGLEYTKRRLEFSSQPEDQALAYFNLAVLVYQTYRGDQPEGTVLQALYDSVDFLKKAVALAPRSNPTYLKLLGRRQYQLSRYLRTDGGSVQGLLTEIIEYLGNCLRNASISPGDKIEISYILMHCLSDLENYKRAAEVGLEALVTLSQLNAKRLLLTDILQNARGNTGISSLVARAIMKSSGSPGKAFMAMERGRSLIADLVIHKGVDLSEVKAANTVLCDEYQRLQDTLYRAQSLPLSVKDFVQHRTQVLEELSEMEERIRRIPGLERFQLPLHRDTICELASEGPLICLDEHHQGCAAYIVTKQNINFIDLPKLYTGAVQELADYIIGPKRITKCSLRKRAEHNEALKILLKWLWDAAVEPVIEHLGFSGKSPPEKLPRVWWITNGLLGLMPMHAAGSGWDKTLANTASRCISSYTSSTAALALSRRKFRQIKQSGLVTRILALHMPQTPEEGWKDLDTRKEMKAIRDQAKKNSTPITIIEHPAIQQILGALDNRLPSQHSTLDVNTAVAAAAAAAAADDDDDDDDHQADLRQPQSIVHTNTILHLACHGDPDVIDPTHTSLLFSSPSKEAVSRLSISQLFDQANLDHIRLAYLSACCTAQQYTRDLINENLYMGSAFQLLGCVNVIGTLWEADDTAAGWLAAGFYSRFLKGLKDAKAEHSSDHDHEESAARCLHAALAELRNRKVGRGRVVRDDVIAWACFICIGA